MAFLIDEIRSQKYLEMEVALNKLLEENQISDKSIIYRLILDKSVYKDEKEVRVKNYNPDIKIACSDGIHVSIPFYWDEGNTLIAVKVKIKDIITCQQGKLRCKAVTVIGEVNKHVKRDSKGRFCK